VSGQKHRRVEGDYQALSFSTFTFYCKNNGSRHVRSKAPQSGEWSSTPLFFDFHVLQQKSRVEACQVKSTTEWRAIIKPSLFRHSSMVEIRKEGVEACQFKSTAEWRSLFKHDFQKWAFRIDETLLFGTAADPAEMVSWSAARTPPSTRAGGQDDGSSKNPPN